MGTIPSAGSHNRFAPVDGHFKRYSACPRCALIDYAMLVKVYGQTSERDQRRYSPPPCVGAIKGRVKGKPDPEHISTSYAERQNLNTGMHTRRFTRLTNAFSKKIENHALAVALFAMYYNFVCIHKTLRVTPAMAAGVTDRLWKVADIVKSLEDREAGQVAD